MNIQDISDFLDLVKNPDKYNKFVDDIKAEQERLKAVIATVGKATELDKLRKAAQADKDSFEKKIAAYEQERQAALERDQRALFARQAAADEVAQNGQNLIQEASIKLEQATKLSDSFAGRDKELRKQEAFVEEQKKLLAAQISEYEEKLVKIRSVLG